MSRSLNSVSLLGNCGNAPEIRVTPNGAKVATLSLATAREWKDANGQKQEKTEWHKLVVWSTPKGPGLVGVIEQYVNKGDKLYVEGRIEYREYTTKEGEKRNVTEINVTDLLLLGGAKKERAADTYADADDSLPF